LESPCNNFVFSLNKEEQSSFGYMPITISDKHNQVNNDKFPFKRPLRQEGLFERQTNVGYADASKAEMPPNILKYTNYPESTSSNEKNNRVNSAISTLESSAKKGITPARVKKNYQYIYE
jgi:hypothetical protein